ncbi:MAG TPA: thioredoxin [Cycloclasticus sp.]|nr:thioredoxin [Cycloclasticus sp.]
MNYSAVFALGAGIVVLIYFARIYLSRFKLIGEPNPARNIGGESQPWQVFYFYSPRCGACKKITPAIEEHAKHHEQVNAVDVSTDLALAQKFNIRTTPTVVFVEKNIVSDVLLGTSALQAINDFIQAQKNKAGND